MAKAKRVIEGWDNMPVEEIAAGIAWLSQRDFATKLFLRPEDCPAGYKPTYRRITITVEDAKPKAGKAKR